MSEFIKYLSMCMIMGLFLYWALCSTVFMFRHPKCNKTVLITHFSDVVKFNEIKEFQ
jgi:hypothetical protein